MKKVVSTLLSVAMVAAMATGFAVSSSAEDVTVKGVIPFTTPSKVPTIDGKISGSEWDKAYTLDLSNDTVGAVDEGSAMNNPGSAKISVLWSSTLVNPEDDPTWIPDLDYDYNEDKIGGLYFKFEVKDTTKAWATGHMGTGTKEANATDAVQLFIDPGLKQSMSNKGAWIYTFTGYSASNPGVGEVPAGSGYWWEHLQIGGGSGTYFSYPVEIATEMHVTFAPEYPHPGEAPADVASAEYKAWLKALGDAYEHITDYQGYTIEAFLPWIALNFDNGAAPIPKEGTGIGMAFSLVDYGFDWDAYYAYIEQNGTEGAVINSYQYINFMKLSIGANDDPISICNRTKNFDLFTLGAPYFETSSVMKGDCNGDGVVSLPDVTKAALHVAGVEVLTGDNFTAADVNGDGSVSLPDVTKIALHVAGIELLD